MVVNAEAMRTLLAGFRKSFDEGLKLADGKWENWGDTVPSNTALERYPITMFLAIMRQWVGSRQVANLVAKYLTVTNVDFELTVGIPMNDIRDDTLGYTRQGFQGIGRNAPLIWPRLATAALTANGDWLDGNAFFKADRTFGAATIANYVTTALSAATFNTAYQAMCSYAAANGEPLEIIPNLLQVGPANRTVAHGIVNQGPGATAANPNVGLVDIEINPRLTGTYANYWFLMCTTMPIKPVMVQKRMEGPLVSLDGPTDDTVFWGSAAGNEGTIPGGLAVYGTHYRGAAAPTLPHLCYGGFKAA